ncbi:hypothetical protein GQ44DRAFT_732727 [Phaeosphaeriaceae sp. PMI808]|nr:hypothetical protein GQ44DRAFT_732727 [Phaeosphaeriaceae sp. PMI808]
MAKHNDGIPFIAGHIANIADATIRLGIGVVGLGAQVVEQTFNFAVGNDRTQEMEGNIANEVINRAKDFLQHANHDPVRHLASAVLDLVCPVVALMDPQTLLTSLLRAGSCVINRIRNVGTNDTTRLLTGILQDSLNLVLPALENLNPELVLATAVKLSKMAVKTVLLRIGQIGVIRAGIYSNELNPTTLAFFWNNRSELASFLLDIVECAKCYASAMSLDGKYEPNSLHGQDNEFDFSQAMNRHAIICQIQRLAKSLIFILESATMATPFIAIDMTARTQLQSDVGCEPGTVIEVRPAGWQRVIHPQNGQWARPPTSPAGEAEKLPLNKSPKDTKADKVKVETEKWIFINGIATEPFWLHLACKKLAKWSSREVTGVYNRGDGILWDLIECGGERDERGVGNVMSQNKLQRTMSSLQAQESLQNQLKTALQRPTEDQGSYSHIVMIAHSQGCLILRLALEHLIANNDWDIRTSMLQRLCIFTFGNPSVNWQFRDGSQLSSYVRHTEHFANEKDFVAKLGVLNDHTRPGYGTDPVFVNKQPDWTGHLFGTQYSLDPSHYRDRDGPATANQTRHRSWLLRSSVVPIVNDTKDRKAAVNTTDYVPIDNNFTIRGSALTTSRVALATAEVATNRNSNSNQGTLVTRMRKEGVEVTQQVANIVALSSTKRKFQDALKE